MTIQELQNRIEKKEIQIKKLEAKVARLTVNDPYGDLRRAQCDLQEAKATLIKYQNQIKVIEDKNNTLNDLPEVLVEFKNNLIKRWDEYDLWKKQTIREEMKSTNYRDMNQKWGRGWYQFAYTSSEDIHKQNVKDAESLVLNLLNRTIEYTGKIIDCKALRIDNDNNGYSIINGLIIGKKGKVRVESIGAGGYNIQRYHIRVLVKEVR